MQAMKAEKLKYIRTAFKGLAADKKEHVLTTARALLEIQEDTFYPAKEEKQSYKPKKNEL